MKIYVDTNVYLDYLLERKNKQGKDLSKQAFEVFRRAMSCEFYVIISNHLLNELHAIMLEQDTRMLLYLLRKKIITVEDEYEHKGDEKHAVLAIKAGADLIVTRNISDFKNFSIQAVLPEHL